MLRFNINNLAWESISILILLSVELLNVHSQSIDSAYKFFDAGRFEKAAQEFEEVLPLIEKEYGANDTTFYSFILIYTGICFERYHQYSRAEQYYIKAKEIYEQMLKLHSHSVSQATSFVQYAGVAALQGDQTCITAMVDEFKSRRDMLVDGLNELEIKCARPDGAFYAFADVSEYGTGEEVAELLLNKAYVAATPGLAFGESGGDFIRISYATSKVRIKEALRRMEATLT